MVFSLKKLAALAQQIKQSADLFESNVRTSCTIYVNRMNASEDVLSNEEAEVLANKEKYLAAIAAFYRIRDIISQENANRGISSMMAELNHHKALMSFYTPLTQKLRSAPTLKSVLDFFKDTSGPESHKEFYMSVLSQATIDDANNQLIVSRKEINRLSDAIAAENSRRDIELPVDLVAFLQENDYI